MKKIVKIMLLIAAGAMIGATIMYCALLNGFSVSIPRVSFEQYDLGLQKIEEQDGTRRVTDADGTVWVYSK